MSIPPDVRAFVAEHDLTQRSSWRASVRTAVVAAVFAGLAVAGFAAGSWIVWLLVWFVQGCVLVGSYSAMHEAAHATLYRSRRVNRVAGVLWASTILVNWSLWRSFHLEHHAHTGSDQDPKLKHKVHIERRFQYGILPVGGLAFMGQLWVESLGTLFGRFPDYVRTRTGRRAIQLDAAVLAGVSALLVAGTIAAPGLVLRLWLAPLLVTFCGVLPATGMSEHYGCALEGEAFDTTRTVLSNRAFRFLVWNNNFHVVHHLLPSVPFHQAPKLHAYIEPRLQHLSPSYLAFHRGILAACGRRPVAVPSSSPSR